MHEFEIFEACIAWCASALLPELFTLKPEQLIVTPKLENHHV